ncbi:MAG TPA: class I adenylate-forming enzyme family protein [Acidimicrobiia bacterium]
MARKDRPAGLLIGDVFRNAARATPTRTAVVLGEATLTFGELDRAANRLARALAASGVGHGDRVVVRAGTGLAVVPLFAALAKLGAVYVPLDPALHDHEVAAAIAAAEPALQVSDGTRTGDVTLAELTARAATEHDGTVAAAALDETDPHVVFFTSGSGGRPKGAVLSHRVNHLRTHPGALLEPRGAMVCPYPLFHMGAWTIALQQWQARDTVVLVNATDAATIVDAITSTRATRINCVPAIWRRVLDHPGADLSTIRFADTGTSATPPELLGAMRAAMSGAQLRVFYGSTEAGSVAMLEDRDIERKPGSVGVPAPSTEVRIDDGQLLVRGPLLFDGYLDAAEATATALAGGWYATGDRAEVDDEGYLSIVGRVGDVIRTGGESVAPSEVEAVLAGLPGVRDVAVIGLPDPEWGEVVCAAVVCDAGAAAPTVAQVRAHCEQRLAPYKHPRRVVVVDAIPRTPATQQIQRRLLYHAFSVQNARPGGAAAPRSV